MFNNSNSKLTWYYDGEYIKEACPDQCSCFNDEVEMSCLCDPNWPRLPSYTKWLTLISSDRATIICDAFDNLNHLEHLKLARFHGIDTCEKYFESQRFSLRHLSLESITIEELPVNVFANLQNLAYLFLYKNRLTRLQDGIFAGLTNLQKLKIVEWVSLNVSDHDFAGLELLTHFEFLFTTIADPFKGNLSGQISLIGPTEGMIHQISQKK
ncbi:insulin-like growth factor-binding protein complex acid labile subunit [Physella acuta]|uniref:insulin-like growth factor-binding protein complex acid labile subunit n=1 Tax=Physella acuta TaxID=109671 RepID=UPI0027DCE79C|nr:insulin-like growth factor-binding protein complex acid labile subunit [Physella acuta]